MKKNPFDELRLMVATDATQRADPFTEKERDAILHFYRAKLPSKQYALVCFRFYMGTWPSEAVALKWGRVDLVIGKAIINSSRTFGEDNAPKTEASTRTITMLPNVSTCSELCCLYTYTW
jgi:hypothetical protein